MCWYFVVFLLFYYESLVFSDVGEWRSRLHSVCGAAASSAAAGPGDSITCRQRLHETERESESRGLATSSRPPSQWSDLLLLSDICWPCFYLTFF